MTEIVLTKEILSRSRVVAKGHRIRELGRILSAYGGEPRLWVKKSSPAMEDRTDRFEYHWYEHHGLGRFEVRRVNLASSRRT